MKLRFLPSVWLCLVPVLAGCHRRVRVAAVPKLPPVVMVNVPALDHPSEPELAEPLEEAPALTVLLPRHAVPRYRPLPVQQVTLAPAAPLPPLDLGQLTTGDAAPLRQQTEDLLRTQERRLSVISPAVAALHSQQLEQARLFLRQAEEAWKKMDVEGARTLATKAKVLLDEVLT